VLHKSAADVPDYVADVACCAADVSPTEIFKRAPEVMFRALVMHNSVIRSAKYANCGFVLEQEGDSFTLAFYNAFDAVAFCLQVRAGNR
jgi:hypothetical protein